MNVLIAVVVGMGLVIYVALLLVRDLATGFQYLVKNLRYREEDYEKLDVRGRLSSRSVWAAVLFVAMLVFLNPFISDFGPSNRLSIGIQAAVSAIGI